ncbi:MAG: sigma-70 family RNA polymerase sigma factor [Phycisphaerales bacterium]
MAHLTTTTQLLESLRRGHDEPVWSLFVERYRPVLVAVARRMGLDAEDAEDAAQQALVEFARDFGRGRYDRSRGRLRTWLLAILRHRVADLKRLRSRRAPGAPTNPEGRAHSSRLEEIVDAGAEDALERIWQAEIERRVLETALDRLRGEGHVTERSLRAFELMVLRDVSAEAAAEACGMTINAVYIARGRVAARLRRLVELLAPAYDEGIVSP